MERVVIAFGVFLASLGGSGLANPENSAEMLGALLLILVGAVLIATNVRTRSEGSAPKEKA